MATTKSNKIGKTRKRLAKIIEAALLGTKVDPADLNSQIPVYASPQWDCCSWYGRGYQNGIPVEFACWRPMSECVRNGIQVSKDYQGNIEIIVK